MDNVTTWADGYGAWHASVPLMGSVQGDAAAARKAIGASLRERMPHGARPPVIHITRERATGHGTVIYREV